MSILQYYPLNSKKQVIVIAFFILLISQTAFSQTASFTYSLSNNCAPTVVTFQNESTTGAGLEYWWNFGKGDGESLQNQMTLSIPYSSSGEYDVTLRVVDGGTSVSTTRTITIYNGPVAGLDISDSVACIPNNIQFTNTSTEGDTPINTYFWDLRNGVTFNTRDIDDYSYNNSGDKSVYLQVTDENGCSSYIEHVGVIKIMPKVVADFVASETFSCLAPLSVSFTNESAGNGELECSWNYGNGENSNSFPGSAFYSETGNYTVSLKAVDEFGCTDSIIKSNYIRVGGTTGNIFAVAAIDTILDDSASICPGLIRFETTLPPQPDFTWQIEHDGSTQIFNNDTTVEVELLDSGYVDLTLILGTPYPCLDTIRKTFYIEHIKADFELDKYYTCSLPVDINTTNLSDGAAGYRWILPNGLTTVVQDTSYTTPWQLEYKETFSHSVNDQSYEFNLIAYNSAGCTDTATRVLNARLPVARFSPDTVRGCIPLQVTFSDSSKSDEDIVEWIYSIDGSETTYYTNAPIQHTFNDTGSFKVELIIENNLGCIDTSYSVNIVTGQNIVPAFEVAPANLCVGDTLTITNTTPLEDRIGNWVFSGENVFHTDSVRNTIVKMPIKSNQIGAHNVDLAINHNGCLSNAKIENAYNVSGPAGSFKESFKCNEPLKYTFISEIESATSLRWDIDGTIINNEDTVEYTFPASDNYWVSLYANYGLPGCKLLKTKEIKVREVSAAFSANNFTCLGDPVLFNASASIDNIDSCYNEGFHWDFGDSITARRDYMPITFYPYTDTGRYTVRLKVVADNGCVDSAKKDINIVAPYPSFTAIPDAGCAPTHEVNFSLDTVGKNYVNWEWTFGDNTTDNSLNASITHVYSANANYVFYPTVLVTDEYGCRGQFFDSIIIAKPNADFQAVDPSVCFGKEVTIVVFDAPVMYTIDYGDGTPPTSDITHTYASPGVYDVALTVTEDGCSSTYEITEYITVEELNAAFTVSDSNFFCYPDTVNFQHLNPLTLSQIGYWQFESGVYSESYIPTPGYTYTRPGIYKASLYVESANGCWDTASKQITVEGPTAEMSFAPDTICRGETVTFTMSNPQNLDSFEWLFDDGETSTENPAIHQYFARGELYPTLILKVDSNDCDVSITDTLISSLLEADFVFTDNKTSYCLHETVTAQGTSSYNIDDVWRLDGEIISIADTISQDSTEEGAHTVLLKVTDDTGCEDTISKAFIVGAPSEFNIEGDENICFGDQANLAVNQESPEWEIVWTPANSVSETEEFITTTTIDSTSIIIAGLINQYGCETTDSFEVFVKDQVFIHHVPLNDTTILLGDTLQIIVSANADGLTYNWIDQDIPDSSRSLLVRPMENSNYKVFVSGECIADTVSFIVEVVIDFYLEFPSAFTPNGDDENDIFVYKQDKVEAVDFQIYNRWGNRVFSTTALNEGWDGTFQGQAQNIDTYTYYIRAVSIGGYTFERKGTFNLLK